MSYFRWTNLVYCFCALFQCIFHHKGCPVFAMYTWSLAMSPLLRFLWALIIDTYSMFFSGLIHLLQHGSNVTADCHKKNYGFCYQISVINYTSLIRLGNVPMYSSKLKQTFIIVVARVNSYRPTTILHHHIFMVSSTIRIINSYNQRAVVY